MGFDFYDKRPLIGFDYNQLCYTIAHYYFLYSVCTVSQYGQVLVLELMQRVQHKHHDETQDQAKTRGDNY